MKKLHPSILTSAAGALLLSTNSFAAVAFNPPTAVNVALNKPTFGDVAFGNPTSRGNDGVVGASNYNHADYNGTLGPASATPYPGAGTNAPNPYWEVDLSGSFDLTQIVVSDRPGCCNPNRLDGSTVTLYGAGGSTVGTTTISIADGVFGSILTFDNGGAGYTGVERVRIDGAENYFQFSEFEATSMVATPLNWAASAPAGYFDGSGTSVASWNSLPASNITDENYNTLSHPLAQSSSGYYAQIDLGQEIMIDNISLTGRLDSTCCDARLQDYTVEFRDASGALVHSMTHAGVTKETETIDVIGDFGGNGPSAQFVRVINADGTDYGPQIGELEVFGVIPEPSSALLAIAGSALLLRRRRK